MLRAEIIIMREGSTQVLAINSFRQAWRYGDRDRWDKRTLALAALEVDDPHKQPEVFICLRMDEPSDLLDRNYVANLIRKVRAHTWGANLYVVFDSQIKIRRVTDNPELLAALLKEIYQAGATDVIHVSMPQLYEYEAQVFNLPATLKGLFESAALSQQRQSKLQTGKQWDCLLRNEDKNLNWLLGESFIVHSRDEVHKKGLHDEQGLLTIVEKTPTQNEMVNVAQAACLRRSHLAALLQPMGESKDTGELRRQGRLEVVRYYGPLELWFLLHLLNTNESPSTTKATTGEVESVARNWGISPPFGHASKRTKEQEEQPPGLLITSSFELTEKDFLLSAAREIGQVTRRKPAHTKYLVHPAANCQNLPKLIKQLETKDLTAWLHIGHGKRVEGLWEACGSVQSAKRWLDCFYRHRSDGGSLALAVFSTCESAEVARLFAEAGVGLAVGFQDEVDTEACEAFTAGLITASLMTNGNYEAILRAFHAGRADLISNHYTDYGLVAFSAESGK